MKTAPVSKLKATISKYLARVKAGQDVVITERGKPIAKIIPFPDAESAVSAHLLELAQLDLVHLGSGKIPKGFWKLPRPQDPKGKSLKALLEERESGR